MLSITLAGRAHFTTDKPAEVETRVVGTLDCVCTNERVYYQPLTETKFAQPVYSLTQSYHGPALGGKWLLNTTRSAFLGTFRQ